MLIKPVAEMLGPAGLEPPTLNALVPDKNNYSVLLIQPRGQIEVTAGVHNRDRALASKQFKQFLAEAVAMRADLAVTPEYSMPWEVLVEAIKAGTHPKSGTLWAFGCESIKYTELEVLKADLGERAKVIYEQLEPDETRFLDPLAYVFMTSTPGANPAATLVVLVQFKTHPMGDKDHFEFSGMQQGSNVYQFGGGDHIRLVSLICSDAFAFLDEDAIKIYNRALVLHIQLNPSPRQAQFRGYRERLLRYGDDVTELICLNWACDVEEWSGPQHKPWKNVAASAWYLRPKQFDKSDETLCANHRLGLYYTWLPFLQVHALFLNYTPATYFMEATKVIHIGVPASVSRRRGPQLRQIRAWNEEEAHWAVQEGLQDGFVEAVSEAGEAKDELIRIAALNPLAAERAVALSTGTIADHIDWYEVQSLESCTIEPSEIVRRITFCQDTDQQASAFRITRLKRCSRLWTILKVGDRLPPALAGFAKGVHLDWTRQFPHQNVISPEGNRATAIYLGEDSSDAQIAAIAKRVAEHLRVSAASDNDGLIARQRLAVWFRDPKGDVALYEPHRYVKIDKTATASEFDIGREQ